MLPEYRCNRCRAHFKDSTILETHQRADEPCARREAPPDDGISKSRQVLLRRRQGKGKSEESRWVEIYQILFPDDDVIPSPCRSKTHCPKRFLALIGLNTTTTGRRLRNWLTPLCCMSTVNLCSENSPRLCGGTWSLSWTSSFKELSRTELRT